MASATDTAPDTPTTADDKVVAMPKKNAHTLAMRRATLYLLEGVLQNPGPCTTPDKIVKWAKAWEKTRKANNRTFAIGTDVYDIEKNVIRREAETDLAWFARQQAYHDRKEKWDSEPVTIVVNDKLRDIYREAVKWLHDHRDDAKVGVKLGGEYAAELMTVLGLANEVPVDEFALDVI